MMLTDSFGRGHNYLRISLTERCNLRCFYCMPPGGIALSPPDSIMTASEIEKIAGVFVKLGVTKIRLTGGEPLVRKDFEDIAQRLSKLNVEIALSTNGILIDQYLHTFKSTGIRKINVSLDTLNKTKFSDITRRDYFTRVLNNIGLLIENGFFPKINVVIIKGVNDNELMEFVELTRKWPVTVQFIEFMPFAGNKWDLTKTVPAKTMLEDIRESYGVTELLKIQDQPHDTSCKYKIKTYPGSFGFISTISNPFCDSCNRIRLTANGRIKNCLFSQEETNLLESLRRKEPVEQLIIDSVRYKKAQRGGINNFTDEQGKKLVNVNRSMVTIGG